MCALKCEHVRFLQDFISDRNVPRPKRPRPKWPQTETAQTEKSRTLSRLPHLSYITVKRPVVGKTILLRQISQQAHYYYRITTKLAQAYQYLLL